MAIITTEEAGKVMKRCQIGSRNVEPANALHAECYGTIGALVQERDRLRELLDEATECIESWGAYASDYLRRKHNLAGDVQRFRNAARGI